MKVDLSDEDAFTSLDWDVAFRRFIIRVNSGVSGPSCVDAARTAPRTDFDALTMVPPTLTYRTEEYVTPPRARSSRRQRPGSPSTALELLDVLGLRPHERQRVRDPPAERALGEVPGAVVLLAGRAGAVQHLRLPPEPERRGLPRFTGRFLGSDAARRGGRCSRGAPDPSRRARRRSAPTSRASARPRSTRPSGSSASTRPAAPSASTTPARAQSPVPAVDANGNMAVARLRRGDRGDVRPRARVLPRHAGFRAPDDLRARGNGGDARASTFTRRFRGPARTARSAARSATRRRRSRAPATCSRRTTSSATRTPRRWRGRRSCRPRVLPRGGGGLRRWRGPVLEEATAVWATEQFDPTLRDLKASCRVTSRPDRSPDQVLGARRRSPYGAAIFFQFLTERHDARVVQRPGPRAAWTTAPPAGSTSSTACSGDYASSFAAGVRRVRRGNLYTGARANPRRAYANGASYPLVTTTRAAPLRTTRCGSSTRRRALHRSAGRPRRARGGVRPDARRARRRARRGPGARGRARGNVVDEPRRLTDHLTGGTRDGRRHRRDGADRHALTNVRTVGPSRTPGVHRDCGRRSRRAGRCSHPEHRRGDGRRCPRRRRACADVPAWRDAGADASVAPAPAGGCGCSTPGPARVRGVGALACPRGVGDGGACGGGRRSRHRWRLTASPPVARERLPWRGRSCATRARPKRPRPRLGWSSTSARKAADELLLVAAEGGVAARQVAAEERRARDESPRSTSESANVHRGRRPPARARCRR